MGRAGGGRGSRGGGGGGGRSSGGRSSSHRSGYSGGSRSYGGSHSSGSHYYGGHRIRYYVSGVRMSAPIGILVAFIVFAVAFPFLASFVFGSSSITASTVNRTPLPASAVNETGYFTDGLGWIDSVSNLTRGMKHFYQKTGVQPYLYITDNINGKFSVSNNEFDTFANQLYDELFTDEGHVLLIFIEANGEYKDWYVAGTAAKQVIDQEAADILLDYIDLNYYSDKTESEFFSDSFSSAADRIMEKTTPVILKLAIVVAVIVVAIVVFLVVKKVLKAKKEHAEHMERILNAPVEPVPGSTGLEYKYKEDE